MKEKELRLALVLFGGVSLPGYPHGINPGLLNLARASRLAVRAIARFGADDLDRSLAERR